MLLDKLCFNENARAYDYVRDVVEEQSVADQSERQSYLLRLNKSILI